MSVHLLDTFEKRLRMEGVLATRTGLHIGAGESGDPLATDSPVVRDASGAPFVPGSSLKGVVRSASEALLRGTARDHNGGDRLWTCDHIAGQPCISHEDLTGIREQWPDDSRAVAEAIWNRSCTVCRLFGSLALASRVRFPDLPLAGGAPLLELRNGVGIDRDKELAASGVLYDFEAVPPETPFRLTVILDNYDDWEVGLLLYLFEQLDQGSLALGGKSSRGLGQVRIDWQQMAETRIDKDNPFAELLSTRDLLRSDTEPAPDEVTEPVDTGPPLPDSGTSEDWKTLADIISEMSEINKSTLGQLAGKNNFKKAELNERLGLGLAEGKKGMRKAWDTVLDRFVDAGFLTKSNGGFAIAGNEPEEAAAEEVDRDSRDPALQHLYDRYVQAMAKKWEASF